MTVNYDEVRQIGLTVGNAMNITAELSASQAEQDPAQYFAENVETIARIAIDLQARFRAEAGLGAVLAELPSYTPPGAAPAAQGAYTPPVAQAAPQAAAPAYVPQQAHAAPAPMPNASAGGAGDPTESNWQLFFQNPNDWYDNRTSKKAPNMPDFRHKSLQDGAGRNLGIWIDGKGVPAWVAEGLRSIGK